MFLRVEAFGHYLEFGRSQSEESDQKETLDTTSIPLGFYVQNADLTTPESEGTIPETTE